MAASQSASISASVASCGRLPSRGQRLLDRGEAPREFLVGRAQRRLRVGIEMAGQVDHGKQQIADLGRGLVAVAGSDLGFDLVAFLADLGQHRQRIVPVEADLAGLVLQLQRAGEGGQGDRHAGQRAGRPAGLPPRAARSAFSSALMRSHRPSTSFGDRPRASPNTCGWRRISFSVIASTTPPKSNAPCSSRHAGVEHDLEQQVAQLVAQVGEIAAGDGVGDLVGLFERVGRDGRKVLLQVPGAAGAGRPQRRHDLEQPADVAGGFHAANLPSAIRQRRDKSSKRHPTGSGRALER